MDIYIFLKRMKTSQLFFVWGVIHNFFRFFLLNFTFFQPHSLFIYFWAYRVIHLSSKKKLPLRWVGINYVFTHETRKSALDTPFFTASDFSNTSQITWKIYFYFILFCFLVKEGSVPLKFWFWHSYQEIQNHVKRPEKFFRKMSE